MPMRYLLFVIRWWWQNYLYASTRTYLLADGGSMLSTRPFVLPFVHCPLPNL